jgi:putative holliday junction resolvase
MPILDYEDFAAILPKRGALIGLDPGSVTIGVAASDATRTIASPASAVKKVKMAQDGAAIFAIYKNREAQAARAFARNLVAIEDVPLLMWDERLSTAAVLRQMITADMTRAKRAATVDAAAASYMLQGLLDRLVSQATDGPNL